MGFFDRFRKQKAAVPPKRCPQCGAEMDADETICPQCGHGREAAFQKKMARAESRRPGEIKVDWLASPSARRLAMRAGTGPEKGWWGRLFGGHSPRPEPPPARRVAARAMILSAVVWRAYVEGQLDAVRNADELRAYLFSWLDGLGIVHELEPWERDFLEAPFGRVDHQLALRAAWRGEGLAVLAWALNRFDLPAYDQPVVPPDAAQESVGFGNLDVARDLLDTAALRPAAEIDRLAGHVTVVGWRLRQFGLFPAPMDYVDYLRRHGQFKETWLEDLRIRDGDLALGGYAIAVAVAEEVEKCRVIADERRVAAYWLQGDAPVYSAVDPVTILSAC